MSEPDVLCPLCKVPADGRSLRCPSCREDLTALARLRYAGRMDYNAALAALRAGEVAEARVLLRRALAAEPGLAPARSLLETLGAVGAAVAGSAGREGDTP
ncbi:hypothetical protein VM98_24795 [Streptomyces rubellomurinus subsp. indigoferus]|uniref:Uncharacterized protein n=1 Tax=Streptomyces rubellomurinus (strain ATCC 31215) TaxID=359131 RepID=A0A0F2TMM6_STRR3|nr:hypothetical protein [Streptomyces rubellomurinus]KJS53509.1 hypothetical protein VM98_24795 [Streptomyces rubellomurinus subsp. indigoferus]KJS62977.1 hypothetical protein VM95_05700 [Streptomyces rubellomurinus]